MGCKWHPANATNRFSMLPNNKFPNKIQMLDLLNKFEYVASRTTTETAVALRFFAHVKRTRLLGVKRAKPHPVSTDSPQWHVSLHHIYQRYGVADPLDVVVSNCHATKASAYDPCG